MPLSNVSREEAASRLVQRLGNPPDSVEALSDLLRQEVHARQHAPRAATLLRLARLLAPAVSVDQQRLDEVCDALERESDVVLAPGGVLYATPTRVVILKHVARIFSSVPTRPLAAVLGREIVAKGPTRTVTSFDGLTDAVASVGGADVSPEVWAGMDRTPPADAALLAKLDQRLEWQAAGAGSLERDGSLEWRTWQLTPEGMRWRRSAEGRLWWARTRFGGHLRAWTSGGSPATAPFVDLSADDADRARFALSRELPGAAVLRIVRSGSRVALELPGWLPRSEYRWLSLHAEPTPETKGLGWEIAADDEAMITKPLVERLGLAVEAT
ncbi:MAG: hypothetical protein WAQ05_05195 [Rubrivivax sp.]